MAESKLWDSWPARVASLAAASVVAALVGAHTDLIRALPQIVPRVEDLSAEVRAYRAKIEAQYAELEGRVSGCEAWRIDHQRYAEENSRELHEAVRRNSGEIEALRGRIDRALERGR